MELRDYQHDAVDAVFDYFEAGHAGHPLIVAPTGTGKSLIIAALIQRVLAAYPTVRVVMLAHVRELISQNLDKLLRVWPEAPVGVYSAGLRQADTQSAILFCGIQSVWNKAKALASAVRPVELVLIDEAHRVPLHENGTYRRFVHDLRAMNPHVRLIGLTATPFRHVPGTKTHTGGYQSLVKGDDRLFTDIVFDLTKRLVPLIREGYLAALWPQPTAYQVSLKGIQIENGDYKADQLNTLMERREVITAILDEAIPLARADRRRHWLVFCAGVESARATAAALQARGITAAIVTGDTPMRERDRTIADFRAGRLTALVSVNTLTVGFDAPVTDCLIVTRPTLSPVLHVQMLGRGMRPTPEKIMTAADGRPRGCLVLDFCGNVDRHGPLDRLVLKEPGLKKAEPMKTCPNCRAEIRLAANPCPQCGHVFPPAEPEPVAAPKAGKSAIIAGIAPPSPPVRYDVTRIAYGKHVGKSGIPTLRVDYFSGFLRVASEWVCLEHDGYARQKAARWWQERQTSPVPRLVQDALDLLRDGERLEPVAIDVIVPTGRGDYPRIVKYEWPESIESTESTEFTQEKIA